jgi:hypothetical protein
VRQKLFTFLSCHGCRFFLPKGPKGASALPPGEAANPAFVGLCAHGAGVGWTIWPGLERAVAQAGCCPDREPGLHEAPRCPLFDTTAESAGRPYPENCVHRGTPACPLATR